TEEKKLLPYKFRIDLQSDNPLKRHTPATPPLEPLLAELKFWIETWEEQATTQLDPTAEAAIPTYLRKVLSITADLAKAKEEKQSDLRARKKQTVRDTHL
ncbi:MAG: hypothetical protein KC431_27885, partial [Myxococcales bacterium]|nr:hypothetical protein [Myxococcales bacterium]